MKKRLLSTVLALCMLLTLTTFALAANNSITIDKEVYLPGESMTIKLTGSFPEYAQAFLYKENARLDQWSDKTYISDLDATNTWKVAAPDSIGKYEVRIYGEYPSDESIAAASLMSAKAFTVSYTGITTPTTPTTPTNPTAPSVNTGAISIDKTAYTLNEQMTVKLSGSYPEFAQVFIYKENAKLDQWFDKAYLSDLDTTLTWKVSAPDDIGKYQVRIYGEYPSDESIATASLMAAKDFTVAYNTTGTPGIKLSKTAFNADEAMSIGATGLSTAQIESLAVLFIYKQNAKLDQYEQYQYVKDLDASNIWKVNAPSDTGIYEVRLYAHYPEHLTDLAAGLLAKATFSVGAASLPNQPVSGSVGSGQNNVSDWAIPEINNAIKEGLVTDKVTVDFSRPITREEFCELAVKLYENISGKTAEAAPANTFTDTTNTEILKAFKLGIANGTGNGLFSPQNSISRQEIATMLLRTVKAAVPQLDTAASNAPAFVDSADIASWAKEGVSYFASKEIIKGANGAFMPKANTTCEAGIALVKRTFDSFSAI